MSSIDDLPPPDALGGSPQGGIDDLPPPDALPAERGMLDRAYDTVLGPAAAVARPVLSGLGAIGNAVAPYTGAPVRAAVGALEDGGGISGAAAAYGRQFGADPSLAPSGKDLVRKTGLPISAESILPEFAQRVGAGIAKKTAYGYIADKLMPGIVENAMAASPAGAAGLAADVATDPLTYVPVGRMAEGAAGAARSGLSGMAERLAEASSGATGKYARRYFAKGTGRYLLDNDITRFGSSPADIAQNAQDAMDAAEATKQGLIHGPLQGAAVDRRAIVGQLKAEIAARGGDESQAGLVRALKGQLADIEAQIPEAPPAPKPLEQAYPESQVHEQLPLTAQRRPTLGRDPETGRLVTKTTPPTLDNIGSQTFPIDASQPGMPLPDPGPPPSKIPLADSESMRGRFDRQAKWNSNSDADVLEAKKIVANIYRQAGEDTATAVGPQYGDQFKAAKEIQHRLIPVQEAAEGRAFQLQQSPHGGLMDLVSIGEGGNLGAKLGGPAGAVIGAGGGFMAKQLRPRFASAGGVTLDRGPQALAGIASPARYAAQGAGIATRPTPGEPAAPEAPPARQLASPPARGEARWAQKGLEALGVSDPALASRLMQDPKARALLIQASGVSQGSKAMKAIQSKIQKGWGTP